MNKTPFISTREGHFTYFDLQLNNPDWKGKSVLDFGGNIGNILKDPNSTIDPSRYWCIDVIREAVEKGMDTYPEAHWVFYNRYNFAFNPDGVPGLKIPDLGQDFDFIISYSVFTHTSKTEMIELVTRLETMLSPNGVLAFTFIDPHYNLAASSEGAQPGYFDGTNLEWRLQKIKKGNSAIDIDSLLKRAADANWCTLVNDQDFYIDDEKIGQSEATEGGSYLTFCTAQYMKSLFPHAAIIPPTRQAYLPPTNFEMHHCCVIRKR